MGNIGDPFAPAQPTIGEAGPAWASDNNAVAAELIARVIQKIDSGSISLTAAEFPHAARTIQVAAADGQSGGATWTKGTGTASGRWTGAAAADTVEVTLRLERNQRLRAVRVAGKSTATAWSARVWAVDATTGIRSQVGTTLISGVLTSFEFLPIPNWPGTPPTVAANIHYVLEFTAGAAGTLFIGAEYDYDRQVSA